MRRVLALVLVLLTAFELKAQMLADEPSSAPVSSQPSSNPSNDIWSSNPRKARYVPPLQPVAEASRVESNQAIEAPRPVQAQPQVQPVQQQKKDDVFVPEAPKQPILDRPTLDGVKRGHLSLRPLVSKEEAKTMDDELIFIYYKDFSIARVIDNNIMCDVTFVVLTNLNRKLSNISVKLKWPKMLTTLSMDDVAPNVETVMTYTLLGDGCYSMDKIPNIIVNRCRVKNMSQEQCASKIRWMKKQ